MTDEQLDARFLELQRAQARARRAEDAVSRVLALCEQAERVSPSEHMIVRVRDVRDALTGAR